MTEPIATSVLHLTDFSPASERAFAEALAIAVLSGARLDIMHAGTSLAEDWERFPAVRRTLERWGLLADNSPRSAVFERLGVAVTKLESAGSPVSACLKAISEVDPDLVVLATEGRNGVARWLRPSVAQAIAHRTRAAALFVPARGRGIVSLADGSLGLEHIVVPVADRPNWANARVWAERLARGFDQHRVSIHVLSVNGVSPVLPAEPTEGIQWFGESAEGDIVENILSAADRANLIVMATEGSHGVWDALRGSTTSLVVRAAPCPVLAVPAHG